MGDVKFISVVIPVFNEEECIPELIGRLQPVLEGLQRPYEVVFVMMGVGIGRLISSRGRLKRGRR